MRLFTMRKIGNLRYFTKNYDGSGIWDPKKFHSGSGGQNHRILDPDLQHWLQVSCFKRKFKYIWKMKKVKVNLLNYTNHLFLSIKFLLVTLFVMLIRLHLFHKICIRCIPNIFTHFVTSCGKWNSTPQIITLMWMNGEKNIINKKLYKKNCS
jgi:hypothetical protein